MLERGIRQWGRRSHTWRSEKTENRNIMEGVIIGWVIEVEDSEARSEVHRDRREHFIRVAPVIGEIGSNGCRGGRQSSGTTTTANGDIIWKAK
jgi:hypothetical protein